MAPLSKIIWLRHEQPDLFKQAAQFIDIKTYVFQNYSILTRWNIQSLQQLACSISSI